MLIDGRKKNFHWKVPRRIRDLLGGRQRYIAALEAMAVPVTMAAWREELKG